MLLGMGGDGTLGGEGAVGGSGIGRSKLDRLSTWLRGGQRVETYTVTP